MSKCNKIYKREKSLLNIKYNVKVKKNINLVWMICGLTLKQQKQLNEQQLIKKLNDIINKDVKQLM